MASVSVIIPVYNTVKYLRRCLESVCGQTLRELEVICVNDASTDASAAILAEYAARDSRVKVVTFERNRGVSVARNAGIDAATGDYLGFVDSDDVVDLDFYAKLYAQAVATGADVVKGNRREISHDGRTTVSPLNNMIRRHNTRFAFAWAFTTAIYRASIIRDNGIRYVEGCPQGEDVLFLNEVMLLSKSLSLVDDAYYSYHRREDSANSRVLSSGEIRAGVETRERIVDNILSAGDVVDDAGKRFVFSFCFKSVLTYACRSRDQASLHYCIDKAFALYGKVSSWLSESDMMVLPVVLPFFKAGDRGGLFAFMCKNRTEQKLMCANLRYLQEQRKHQSQKGE